MRRQVGLRTLAVELGVDVSTVSRALRDDPRVAEPTRRAAREAAQRLGYRPNAAARALRAGLSGRVAVLLSPPQQRFASPIFLELLAALDARARRSGRSLAVFAAADRDEEAAIVAQVVDERLADALVLGRTRRGDPRVALLLEAGLPFVTFGRTDWPDAHPVVEIDYARAGRLAVAALADTAEAPIRVLAAPEGLNFADNYVAGAQAEARARGLPAPAVARLEMTEGAGEAYAAATLAAGGPRPSYACIQDSLAFGVLRAAAGLGRRGGRDFAVFGGQNFPGSEHAAPALSTFSTQDARVAELLSAVLVAHLERGGARPAEGFEHHLILPEPLLRASHLLEA